MLKDLIPIFIGGHPKSGTTLLLSLLDSHSELLVFPEEIKFFNFILKQKKSKRIKTILSYSGAHIPSLDKVSYSLGKHDYSNKRDYSNINGKKYLNSLKKSLSKAKNDKELFLAIFDNWQKFTVINRRKLKYLVEKSPDNELYKEKIIRVFPNAKFLHIIRDPRDNYLTYKKLHPKLNVEEFCCSWSLSTKTGLKSIKKNNYFLLKYEDLITQPKKILKDICNFLDINFEKSLLLPTRNGIVWKGNSMFGDDEAKIHNSSLGRYKRKLLREDVAKIEGYLFIYLKKLNYNIEYAK